MSELRTQLDQAKRDHLAARYPGDLAADLLPAPPATRLAYAVPARRPWLFWTNVGVLGAVAAALVLVFCYLRPTASVVLNPGDDEPIHVVSITKTRQPPADDEFSIVPQLVGTSLTPQGGDVVPSTATAVSFPAMPSFPSMTDVLDAATTTTPDTTDNDANQNNQHSHKETT